MPSRARRGAEIDGDENAELAALALAAEVIVDKAVAEHSLNQQNIEAEITKQLLPLFFKSMGIDRAKSAIEKIIHISRIGLDRRNHPQ